MMMIIIMTMILMIRMIIVVFFIFGSLKKGNRPFLFIFLLAEHHGYAKT